MLGLCVAKSIQAKLLILKEVIYPSLYVSLISNTILPLAHRSLGKIILNI